MKDVDYWHARLRDGDLGADERAAFERWRTDPANAAQYAELDRLMTAVDELMATPQMVAEADAALAQARKRRARRLGAPVLAAGGALVAALLLLAVLAPGVLGPAPGDSFRTAVGERETVDLPDGSRVTLNTASEARVRFTGAERRIELVQGQALFVVASEPARPFVVVADGATVTAVGTVFDVRKDEDAVTVTLVEGMVDVSVDASPSGEPDASPQAHPAARPVPLEPGEQLRVSRRDATAERRAADVDATLGWTEGVLIFKRTPLAEAIAEVNRYTTRPLRLGDDSLAGLELSGVFRAGDPSAFAWTLAETFPVRLEDRGDHTLVLSRAPNDLR